MTQIKVMSKKIFVFISFAILFVLIFAISFLACRNIWGDKEFFVDLGDGWKSYSHKKIGISVKVPEDTTTQHEADDKKVFFLTTFSKGVISNISSTERISLVAGIFGTKKEWHSQNLQKYQKLVNQGEENDVVTIKERGGILEKNDRRTISYEFKLNEHIAFVTYSEVKGESEIGYSTESVLVRIIGYNSVVTVNFNPESLNKINPEIKRTSFLEKGDEYIGIAREYILSVNEI